MRRKTSRRGASGRAAAKTKGAGAKKRSAAPKGRRAAKVARKGAATKGRAVAKVATKAVAKRRKPRVSPASANHAETLAPEATPTARRAADRPRAAAPPSRPPKDRSRGGGAGVRELSWVQVEAMARELATAVLRSFDPDAVVGVVKGGVYAGREVAAAMHRSFLPVRLHARSRDAGGLEASDGMPESVAGKRLLLVDDIAGTGATLRAAIDEAKDAGAREVLTCTLVVREGGWRPDWFSLETSDLVVLPWDYEPTTGAVGSAGDEFGV